METVQIVFESITGNIFYMILAVALIILIGYGLVKNLFKLVMRPPGERVCHQTIRIIMAPRVT